VGCSEKHQASQSLPSTKTSASASKTLPPVGPADFPVPAEAREQSPAGAEAALRYYLALITHQAAKGGGPLRDLSRNCTFCEFLANRADADASAGYSYQGGKISIDDMSAPALHDDLAEFSFTASQTAVAVLDTSGKPATGRGDVAIEGLNGGATMSWSTGLTAWLMNQLVFDHP
jgi:hypothetical protein